MSDISDEAEPILHAMRCLLGVCHCGPCSQESAKQGWLDLGGTNAGFFRARNGLIAAVLLLPFLQIDQGKRVQMLCEVPPAMDEQ